MSERGKAGRAGGRKPTGAGARAALIALVFLFAGGTAAQPQDAGRFEALEGRHELVDGVYQVSGLFYLRLSTESTLTLQARQPLTIRVEVQFLNRLWFWWDNAEFERVVRYRLSHYSLSDSYIVEVEPPDDDGEAGALYGTGGIDRQIFPTLEEALGHIGRLESLPIVAASELDRNLRYDIRIRAALDRDELAGPFRLLAVWRNDWSISSEWLSWRLDAE